MTGNVKSLVNWYGEKEVRSQVDDDGQIWFVAKDVCDVLDIKDSSQAVERLDYEEKLMRKLYVSGQDREMWIINESGLYSLVLTSNKPEAKKFKKWVTSEVLPEIRQSGKYFIKRHEMYSRIELMREIEKAAFKSMTQSLKDHGEAERTHGHAYSLYNNLIYKLVLGKTAKDIKNENGLKETDSVKDFIDKDKLIVIDGAERLVDAMLRMGHEYENIKFNLEKMLIKNIKYKSVL